jgi:uncharacterized membrane protein
MQAFVETIKAWQLHPVVDHFTVALIVVSILVDLVASLFPTRTWMRLMALTLMILGTAAAWGSNVTGGWEAGRVWENVNGPAMIVLKRHAWLGDKLPWVFLVLAVWRIGVQFTLFLDRARPIYMLVALIAGGLIIYQGSLGGRLVYEYGVGTALQPQAVTTESPEASPTATPAEPSPIPTVFNPNATPTPEVTASPTPSESPTPEASPSASESPSASAATPESSPSEEASPGATPTPKNL